MYEYFLHSLYNGQEHRIGPYQKVNFERSKSGLILGVAMANSARRIVDVRTEPRQAAATPRALETQARPRRTTMALRHHGNGLAHSTSGNQRSFREVKCQI